MRYNLKNRPLCNPGESWCKEWWKGFEKELRESDFYKFPDIDLNANKLIKEILGDERSK